MFEKLGLCGILIWMVVGLGLEGVFGLEKLLLTAEALLGLME